jgi:hypothetical protein
MRIDGMAIKGYDYAIHAGKIPEFETDMDLMAFNAGISNANIRHNHNIPPITEISKKVYHQSKDRESDKTLGIICNQ